jgi:capsular exopolysaccharide synthesis family protein
LLLAGPLVAALGAIVFVQRATPIYEATSTVVVSRPTGTPGVDDSAGGEALARTYAENITTRTVMDQAAGRIGIDNPNTQALQQATRASTVTGTPLLHVTVADPDPSRAADLANAIVAVFADQNAASQTDRLEKSRANLEQLMASQQSQIDGLNAQIQQLRGTVPASDPQITSLQSQVTQLQSAYSDTVRTYQALRVSEAQSLSTVSVIDPAAPPTRPARPNALQIIALAIAAGLVVAGAVAAAAEYLDDTIRGPRQLTDRTGLRALAAIPVWRAAASAAAVNVANDPANADARCALDAYRLLYGALKNVANARPHTQEQPQTILVTSASRAEGKSVTAANLAAAIAETGRRVLLVDADVRRADQMRRFDVPNAFGFSTLLGDASASMDNAVVDTQVHGLRLLPSGPDAASGASAFVSRNLATRIGDMRAHYDVVVFDTPAVLDGADAALLAQHVNGVLLVVDTQASRGKDVVRALETLASMGAHVWGALLNRASSSPSADALHDTHSQAAPTQADAASAPATAPVRPATERAS